MRNHPLGARKRTNKKLNPHMTPGPGIEPGTHWWEASALTTGAEKPKTNISVRTVTQKKNMSKKFFNSVPTYESVMGTLTCDAQNLLSALVPALRVNT